MLVKMVKYIGFYVYHRSYFLWSPVMRKTRFILQEARARKSFVSFARRRTAGAFFRVLRSPSCSSLRQENTYFGGHCTINRIVKRLAPRFQISATSFFCLEGGGARELPSVFGVSHGNEVPEGAHIFGLLPNYG